MAALWHEEDGFYYDVLGPRRRIQDAQAHRSLVGLLPLFAVETLEPADLAANPEFAKRMAWFIENRPELKASVACMETPGLGERRLLAVVWPSRLERVLQRLFDETEFFGDYGIRAVSRSHRDQPYTLRVGTSEYAVAYEPAESSSGLFGGNSNWRGPVWFPINYLLIESLRNRIITAGEALTIEDPIRLGERMPLWEAANAIVAAAHRHLRRATSAACAPVSAATSGFNTIRISGIISGSTSISTAITARGSERAIRPAGPASWPSCCSRAGSIAARKSSPCGCDAAGAAVGMDPLITATQARTGR